MGGQSRSVGSCVVDRIMQRPTPSAKDVGSRQICAVREAKQFESFRLFFVQYMMYPAAHSAEAHEVFLSLVMSHLEGKSGQCRASSIVVRLDEPKPGSDRPDNSPWCLTS